MRRTKRLLFKALAARCYSEYLASSIGLDRGLLVNKQVSGTFCARAVGSEYRGILTASNGEPHSNKQSADCAEEAALCCIGAVHSSPVWLRSQVRAGALLCGNAVHRLRLCRIVYNNRHRISKDVWRSAQPAPHHVGWLARRGIKTIVNLRGEQTFGTRWLEQQACARHGVKLVDLALKSRAAPTRAKFWPSGDLLANVEYPILVHCKSGADRAGVDGA